MNHGGTLYTRQWRQIKFIFSSVTTGKGQSDKVCDILVPNELKNAEHLGLTVWLASRAMLTGT